MPESFGARLRQRREERHIALATIADETKIKLSLLEALERDDVSHWPSGIFGRAYIRAYAHAIGLCPDDVVRQFLEVHPEPPEPVSTVEAIVLASHGLPVDGGPPTRLRYIVGSALGSLSRFRRSAAADAAVAAGAAAIDAPGLHEPRPPAHSPETDRVEHANEVGRDAVPGTEVSGTAGSGTEVPDLLAVADLCTRLGRIANAADARPLLEEVARILDATGLVVWMWDEAGGALKPALAYGYSDRVLAQLPAVRRDSDNATAAAFRLARTCAVDGGDRTSGALVVPLLTAAGCSGVLALELQHRGEQAPSRRSSQRCWRNSCREAGGIAEDPTRVHVRLGPEPADPLLAAVGKSPTSR